MSFVEKYKKGLAIIAGTICLVVALWLPAKFALGMTEKQDVWTNINWIFLGLSVIFLWGEIAALARTAQEGIKRIVDSKTGKKNAS